MLYIHMQISIYLSIYIYISISLYNIYNIYIIYICYIYIYIYILYTIYIYKHEWEKLRKGKNVIANLFILIQLVILLCFNCLMQIITLFDDV